MAIERGPIVYCAEWPEVEGGHVLNLLFDATADLRPSFDSGLYGGVTVIDTTARSLTNPSSPVLCTPPACRAYSACPFQRRFHERGFLPSRDELALMFRNLKAGGIGDFRDGGVADNFTYWTSSQQTADMAAHIDFADLGRQHGDDKDFPRRVRAIRAI
jgi:hypothetical protein